MRKGHFESASKVTTVLNTQGTSTTAGRMLALKWFERIFFSHHSELQRRCVGTQTREDGRMHDITNTALAGMEKSKNRHYNLHYHHQGF